MADSIPHRVEFYNSDGHKLIGCFERTKCNSNKVTILLHGMYQHKNVNFLKPYGTRIAEDADLAMSTFRFDCRGLGESEGVTSFTPYKINLQDLEAAVQYLETNGMQVECLFGYSAGGNVAMMFAAKHGDRIPYVLVLSSRFTMDGIYKTLTPQHSADLKAKGSFDYVFRKRGEQQTIHVTQAVMDECVSVDMQAICRAVPASCKVLCTHGLIDDRVPTTDSAKFVSNLANISQHLIAGGGHNYNEVEGIHDELYTVFKKWKCIQAAQITSHRQACFGKL